jgi:YVTN family beta-propeller protein
VASAPGGSHFSGRKTLFSANGPSNDVSVIDLATQTVTKKIPATAAPGAWFRSHGSASGWKQAPSYGAGLRQEGHNMKKALFFACAALAPPLIRFSVLVQTLLASAMMGRCHGSNL